MRPLPALIVAFGLVLPVTAWSDTLGTRPATQAEVRAALFDLEVKGEYASGQRWSERFSSSMTSRYEQDGRVTPGRMHFKGDHLCFTYDRDLTGGCFEVWHRSANCFDFYGTGGTGLPMASVRQRRGGTGWTARAWRTDKPSTCTSDQMVWGRSRTAVDSYVT